MLYERGSGELYYDEPGNYVESRYSRCGVRQGCVLGAFLFCLAMKLVYSRLGELLGANGVLYSYSDDVYLVSDPISMAHTLSAALAWHLRESETAHRTRTRENGPHPPAAHGP
jgi:hypothetical protein